MISDGWTLDMLEDWRVHVVEWVFVLSVFNFVRDEDQIGEA
jgi:hypothetical protein